MADKDSAFVTFEDLKNYTSTLKKYIDFKLVPVPSDCEQLDFTSYSEKDSYNVRYYFGWTPPKDINSAADGTEYEYFFVENNKIVYHFIGYYYYGGWKYKLPDDETGRFPTNISTESGMENMKLRNMVFSTSYAASVVNFTASALTTGKAYTYRIPYNLDVALSVIGRYTVYARKIK